MPISPNDVHMVGVPYSRKYGNQTIWYINANVDFHSPSQTVYQNLLQVVRRQYAVNNNVYVNANVYTLDPPAFETVKLIRCLGCRTIATEGGSDLIVCEQLAVFGTLGEDKDEAALQRYFKPDKE